MTSLYLFVTSFLFFMMSKRYLVSTLSAALAFGMVAPAFAYVVPEDFVRSSRRLLDQSATTQLIDHTTRRDIRDNNVTEEMRYRDRSILQEIRENQRATQKVVAPKDSNLMRGRADRRLRRLNRRVKPGYDRYRILNLRPNTRYLRRLEEESSLPASLVRTGGNFGYDKPTRRDIRENAFFSRMNDRDRDVLKEMQN